MRTNTILFLILTLLLVIGCEDNDSLFDDEPDNNPRITGFGRYESESVVVNEFSSIDLENVSNVYVTTGKERKVTFTAYENILTYMDAVVIGDELILKFNKNININSDREIKVEISAPAVDEITLSGVGNFYIKGSPQESLELNLDGVGNIEAFDLQVQHGMVDINGLGNVEIDAKISLEVDIDGLGNVFYRGRPDLSVDINGLGEIIKD